jgi:hypothetical protein
MESLTAFFALAALVLRYLRKDRASTILFTLAGLLVVVLLRLHASDALMLNF